MATVFAHQPWASTMSAFVDLADAGAATTARSFYKVFGEALLELPPLSERGRCKITYVVHKTVQQEILRSHASGSVGRRYFGRSALLRSVGVTSVSVTSVGRSALHRSVGVTPVSNSIVTRKPDVLLARHDLNLKVLPLSLRVLIPSTKLICE